MSDNEMTTRPTIEAVLERINALGQQLSNQITAQGEQLNKRIDELETRFTTRIDELETRVGGQIGEIRVSIKDIYAALRDMDRKFEIFNKNLLQVQADYRELRERIENLESKAS